MINLNKRKKHKPNSMSSYQKKMSQLEPHKLLFMNNMFNDFDQYSLNSLKKLMNDNNLKNGEEIIISEDLLEER